MTTTRFSLASGNFSQDWSNAGLITTDDNWSGVPSIVGYLGDYTTASPNPVDARTITAAALTTVDVIANQTNPTTLSNGGVAEFAIANPTIALNGSGTADAPSIVCYLDATGRQSINFQCTLRDLDASADNAVQQIVIQYRTGGGTWVNATGGYFADVTTGGTATQTTAVNVTLGADADNSSTLEIRVLTTNAAGNDEWVGIDDIVISSTGAAADTTAPTLTATNPTDPDDGVVAVAADSNIVLRFTENVVGVTGNIVISDGQGDTRTISVTDGSQISFSGSTVTINPTADLIGGHTYSVTTAAGTIEDAAGNDFGGIAAGVLDFTVAAPLTTVTIGVIQGLGHMSQFVGTIARVEGVVTAIDSNGYYIQSAAGTSDGDSRTSDGILVFTNTRPTGIVVGDLLQVTGTVTEFFQGGVASNNLSVTELTSATSVRLGTGIVDTVVLGTGPGDLAPPTTIVDNDNFATYDPAQDGIDFYESLEGMLVTVATPQVVSLTDGQEVYVVASNGVGATGINANGGITINQFDGNPERIKLFDDSGILADTLGNYTIGDRLSDVTGIVNYFSGSYEVALTRVAVQTLDVAPPRETTTLVGDLTHLTVAGYNVENLGGNDPQAKFNGLASDIVNNLKGPDIIAVQELQDADGAGNGADLSGTVSANRLIAAIDAAGGPHYTFVEVAPATANSSGGEPGGNIRNAYFYNAARVSYVPGSAQALQDPAFNGTRKPLAADFVFNNQTIHLVNVHQTSRLGSEAQFGDNQPPVNAGDGARTAQATAVNTFIQTLVAADAGAKVAVLGDFNGFTWEASVQALVSGGLHDLADTQPVNERYSYLFDGNSQELDHVLISGSLQAGAVLDAVHINAEQLISVQTSDHDPLVALFDFGITLNGTEFADTINGSAGSETINGLGGNDALNGNGGSDTINGGEGNDVITGGAGTNFLFGDNGDDSFGAETVSGTQKIDGGDGTDTLIIGAGGASVDLGAGTLSGGLFAAGSSVTDVENVRTTTGLTSAVSIIGSDGINVLTGGNAADTIDGRGGNDRITGGLGGDTLSGGLGNDTFIFKKGEVAGDIILDFDGKGSGIGDQLSFVGFGRGAFLTHVGNAWEIHYGNQVEAFTLNVSSLATNDVIFG